jgi:spore germination protein KB
MMKISGIQNFWMMFSFIIGNTMLISVSRVLNHSKQDSWISNIIALLIGTLCIFIAIKAGQLFPELTLVELCKFVFGKWLGTFIILVYLFQWYTVIANILSEFTVFAIAILLPNTPSWILFFSMLLLVIYVVYSSGIEGIGRCSEVFGPIIFLSVLLLILFSITNMEVKKILPVFVDTGFVAILKGAVPSTAFFAEVVIILMLIKFLDDKNKGPYKTIWGLVLSGILTTIVVIGIITIIGPKVAAKQSYPFFDMINYINIMEFIQNLEIIAVLVWILSVFIKLSVYLFVASYGTAQLFKFKDWRKCIWIVAFIVFILFFQFENERLHGFNYIEFFWLKFALPVNMIIIPFLLWVVGSFRKRTKRGINSG